MTADDESRFVFGNAYRMEAVERDGYTRIRTICMKCEAEYVGNVDDIIVWQEKHYNGCIKAQTA